MKIWVAYRFTGADVGALKVALRQLRSHLGARGYEMVTMLEDIQGGDADRLPKDEAVRRMYSVVPTCDMALCVFTDTETSEGRGFEAGYFAGLGKPVIVAMHAFDRMPYHEALFAEAPSDRGGGLPTVIRYRTFADIAAALPEVSP